MFISSDEIMLHVFSYYGSQRMPQKSILGTKGISVALVRLRSESDWQGECQPLVPMMREKDNMVSSPQNIGYRSSLGQDTLGCVPLVQQSIKLIENNFFLLNREVS
jgi:hypothetical protein